MTASDSWGFVEQYGLDLVTAGSRELVIATAPMAASLRQVAHRPPVVAATFDQPPEQRGYPAGLVHFGEALALSSGPTWPDCVAFDCR